MSKGKEIKECSKKSQFYPKHEGTGVVTSEYAECKHCGKVPVKKNFFTN